MSHSDRSSMFAPFAISSFRFQWSADLLTSWAFEMETIILGWYILVETKSVLLLTVFASLQFLGTLIAPAFGLFGDRVGHRTVLCLMRLSYAFSAMVLAFLASTETLSPLVVLLVAGVGGLVRPSDIGLRSVLISEILPHHRLMGAIGLGRITTDSARVAGALVGGSAVYVVGMGWAYVVVVAFYILSALLMLGVNAPPRTSVSRRERSSLWSDMTAAGRAVWEAPPQLAAILLAFLVNFTAYPFTLGLLPYLARDVYQSGETGLGYLSACVGFGAICAALLLTRIGSTVRPARMMFVFSVVWHLLVVALGFTSRLEVGSVLLFLNGAASMLCLLPMAVLLLRGASPELRGRVMGIRSQAVYGLPLGLLASGPAIESFGFQTTAVVYGIIGTLCTLIILGHWHRDLWPLASSANRG